MSGTCDYSYIGKGKVYLAPYGSGPARFVGNVSALSFSVSEEKKELLDYTSSGGGKCNSISRISAVEASMTLANLSPKNIAAATFGAVSAVTAGAVTNELQTGYLGGLVQTDYMINTAVAPVVEATNGLAAVTRANTTAYALNAYMVLATPDGNFYKATTAGTSAASPPTMNTTLGATTTDGTVVWTNMGKVLLVVTTDYTVSAAGIFIEDAARFTDGQGLTIDYTKKAGNVVEALTESAGSYTLIFDGLNEAQSGRAVTITLHKIKFGPLREFGIIGDDFANLEMAGEVLSDDLVTTTGLSKYFKVAMAS